MGLGSSEWTAAVVHLSPVEEDAAAGVEEAGFTRLHTPVIIILLQIPNSTLFFCFLLDRLTGLMKAKPRASENGRFHIFCVFFPPQQASNVTTMRHVFCSCTCLSA